MWFNTSCGGLTIPWLAMLLICRRHVGPTAKCRHFWLTRPCCADTKLIPIQHFCVGDGQNLPLSSFLVPEYACTTCQKHLHTLSCLQYAIGALSEILLLTTTIHNNQQSHTTLSSTGFSPIPPWLGQWHHQLMVRRFL